MLSRYNVICSFLKRSRLLSRVVVEAKLKLESESSELLVLRQRHATGTTDDCDDEMTMRMVDYQ
jgi:hypothetical protein